MVGRSSLYYVIFNVYIMLYIGRVSTGLVAANGFLFSFVSMNQLFDMIPNVVYDTLLLVV